MYHDAQDYYLMNDDEGSPEIDENKPRILFLGAPRSGKTSILLVIFEQREQLETIAIEPSSEIIEYEMYGGIEVYDFPGQNDEEDFQSLGINRLLGVNTAVVFVLDTQDDVQRGLLTLLSAMSAIFSYNPSIPFHIFLHKIDGLSEELRQDISTDIQQKVIFNMDYRGWDSSNVQFYVTSIYNKSIYEAMSRVSHKLFPHVNILESLLNSLCFKSNLDNAYIFDMNHKLYIASDSSPSTTQSHRFCCDTIGLIEDLTKMYSRAFQFGNRENSGNGNFVGSRLESVIQLQPDYNVIIYQINERLMLVCMMRGDIDNKMSLLELNASKISSAVCKVLE